MIDMINMNAPEVRQQFTIFKNRPGLVYFDNAATTQTPDRVLDAMNGYYTGYRANIHRGLYDMSDEATEAYEKSRLNIADFIGARAPEIVFTPGLSMGINMLAYALGSDRADGNIVLTEMEHHSNMIPWQEMARRHGFELRFIPVEPSTGRLNMAAARALIDEKTVAVSFCSASNTLGTINPVQELCALTKRAGAISIVDVAQSAGHLPISVREWDCDFLVFSGHKMYGPTGIGVLYGKKERLDVLEPVFFGGGMIREVTLERASWADSPHKFEAGTPPIAEAVGLGEAVGFLSSFGMDNVAQHEKNLSASVLEVLKKAGASIVGPDTAENRMGVISFTLGDIHPHDIADILNRNHIAVRAGHHCAMPLMKNLGISGTVRVSVGVYNSLEDIDRLAAGIEDVKHTCTIRLA